MSMTNQRVELMKYSCLSLCALIFIIFIQSNNGSCREMNDLKRMEKISIDAVNTAYGWTKKYSLIPKLIEQSYFSKTSLFQLHIADGPEPPPKFIVGLGEDRKHAVVFFPYKDAKRYSKLLNNETLAFGWEDFISIDINKFSNIVVKESLELDRSNIRKYIDSFLYLTSIGSNLIDGIDDIEYLPYDIIASFDKYKSVVKPLKYDFSEGKIRTEFCSWNHRGFLLKWNLLLSQNGEVLSFKAEEIVSIVIP